MAKLAQFAFGLLQYLSHLVFFRPNIIHIHTSSYGSFFRKGTMVWIAAIFKVPVVLHVHGSEFHKFHNDAPAVVKSFISRTFLRAGAVIALGDTWASRLRRIAPGANVVVLPNAIQLEAAVDQLAEPVRVVFLGEVCDRKGAFVLIEAWAKLRSFLKDSQLTIAGNGQVHRAQQLVDDLGIQTSVHVRGWIAPAEVRDLLSETHILVLPSLNEGQPMAILEAMARGICVVASRSGGIPDMVDDSSGVLITQMNSDSLAEALRIVIGDPTARTNYGIAARRRIAQDFDIDSISERIEQIYNDISPL